MSDSSLVSVHLIVKDGEKYIRKCLEAVLNQNFEDFEILVFDNNSSDNTLKIVKEEFLLPPEASGAGGPRVKLVEFDKNYGLGGGFNRSLSFSNSKYVVLLCVDVILTPDFLKEAVKIMERYPEIGAFQPKVLQWDFQNDKPTNIIDTTGFEIFKSRRIINRGHGEEDLNQYSEEEVFSYEGACPIFRRQALEDAKLEIGYEYLDEDFEWYADDIDLGWRLRLLGWKSFYSPKAVAFHDRQTTKSLRKSFIDFIRTRRKIPAGKRMLDFRNQRLSMVKNENVGHFLKDSPPFFLREIQLFIYFLVFERTTLRAVPGFLRLLPKMLRKRRWIMRKRKVSKEEIKKWFR